VCCLLRVLLDYAFCCCRQGLLRGMPTMMYYMARHGLSGRMGWGPKYTVVMLQHQAHKGLDQVSRCQIIRTDVHL
jgi:hypothetical protein